MKWYKKLGMFFAILFSILYSVGLVALIIMFFMSSFFKGNIYGDILKSINLNEVKLSDFDPRLVSTFGRDVTLEEAFISSLEKAGVDGKVAKEIANNGEVKEVVGEFVGDIVNYSVNGGDIPQIKEEDVETILDNIDTEDIIDEYIEKDEIMKYVNDVNINAKDYLTEGFNYAN